MAFVSEIFYIAGPVRDMAEFALSDPSLAVRVRAFSNLMWMNNDDETRNLLMEVDEAAFEAAIEQAPLGYIPFIFRTRALQVYRRILAESSDPAKRLMAAANAILMGQLDVHAALRECLEECSTDRVRQMDQRELRPLLEALTSDRGWRSDWIVRRVLEGALCAEQWCTLIDPIDADLREELLRRLERRSVKGSRARGAGSLKTECRCRVARRIFARIHELHKAIAEVLSIRSESNLTRARELGELRRQISRFSPKDTYANDGGWLTGGPVTRVFLC